MGFPPILATYIESHSPSMTFKSLLVSAALLCLSSQTTHGFGTPSKPTSTATDINRRRLIQSTAAAILSSPTLPTLAAETTVEEVPLKTITDDLFSISLPQRFFAIRRTVKGDLPDAKTGKGRRGGTIFTAGDMSKAEVVAVER
jgi:hypothetical protein